MHVAAEERVIASGAAGEDHDDQHHDDQWIPKTTPGRMSILVMLLRRVDCTRGIHCLCRGLVVGFFASGGEQAGDPAEHEDGDEGEPEW